MYNEQLEQLIDAALADGELTEKEKQILFKKAQDFGVDLDEFEMILDGRLYKLKQNQAQPSAPKSEKFGDIRKCPSCGAILQAFQTKCPDCGFEFKGVESVKSAQILFDSLQAAELRKSETLAHHEAEKQRRLNDLSVRHNSESGLIKIIGGQKRNERLEEERETLIRELNKAYQDLETKLNNEKANIIKNYPVPNSKEDLMELLAMATSNAYDNDGVVGFEEEVWIQKADQVYQKIVVCSDNDPEMLEQASNMIMSLMRRLPKQYKNFTKLPQKMRVKMEAEMKAEKERKKEMVLGSIKNRGIWAGPCLLLGVIFQFLWNKSFVFGCVGIAFLIAAGIGVYILKKDIENINSNF